MKQIRRFRPGKKVRSLAAAVAVMLTLGALPVLAAGETPAAPVPEKDQEAMAILLNMAKYIATAPAFGVTMQSGYDAIQEDGQRIEFGERRKVLLKRPDRLRVEAERSDGDKSLVLFDGNSITAFKADDNVYARTQKSGTLDEVVIYLVRDLQFTLPMARLFISDLPTQLEKQVTAIHYVEENMLFDVPTDHLAVRSEQIDMQLWIAQGDQPLPRRIILTYKNTTGEPQYRADFREWTISPEIAENSFTFSPPADAEQIPLLAPVRQKGSIPPEQGGKP